MSAMVLTAREGIRTTIDLSGVTPDRLAALDRSAIGGLPLATGDRLDALFEIGDGDPGEIVIRPRGATLLRAGAGMRSGSLTIEGDAGDFAGQAMHGGRLVVTGNAGDYSGSPLPGDRQGMRGGLIAILGDAGERTGERMRRGLIVVGGRAGGWTGANMLAGTIIVAGACGPMPGFGLVRGSLVLMHPPARLPATFNDGGVNELLFLELLDRHLRRQGPALARLPPLARRMRRHCGDLARGGTGEILTPA